METAKHELHAIQDVSPDGDSTLEIQTQRGRCCLPILECTKNGLITAPPNLKGIQGKTFPNATIRWKGQVQKKIDLLLEESTDNQLHFSATDTAGCALLWSQANIPEKFEEKQDPPLDPEKIPGRGLYTEDAKDQRLDFLCKRTGASLGKVGDSSYPAKDLNGNIENYIGSVEVPVGVAGPLKVNGDHAKGTFFVPLATSEGALVGSATRGATAITKAGGVVAKAFSQRMFRAPLFVLGSMREAELLGTWITDHLEEIRQETRKYSNHAALSSIEFQTIGRNLHAFFIYETGDAAGQNMTTTCTWHACLYILKQIEPISQIHVEEFMVEGGMSTDKKVSLNSIIKGRGIQVQAECFLPEEIVKKVLKISPTQLAAFYNRVTMGSIYSGQPAVNANIANIIAAVFTATGQDIACVHESASGNLHMEVTQRGDLYASISLPCLIVGTVGGGTSLAQQRECLAMMGCSGVGNAHKLAEITAGLCLALDLSTLAAIASGQFAHAHERLGRNRPVNHLRLSELDHLFFNTICNQTHLLGEVVESSENREFQIGSSIVAELSGNNVKKPIGLFAYDLSIQDEDGQVSHHPIVAKIKANSEEMCQIPVKASALCDGRLAAEYKRMVDLTEFKNSNKREILLCQMEDDRFTSITPRHYGGLIDNEREIYALFQEKLTDVRLLDAIDENRTWDHNDIKIALRDIGRFHSLGYGGNLSRIQLQYLPHLPKYEDQLTLMPLYRLLARNAHDEFPSIITEKELAFADGIIANLPVWWADLDTMQKTLIHGDFTIRNAAIRKGESPRLCVYDWELAAINLPQRDLMEFLCFALDKGVEIEELSELISYHRKVLADATGQPIDSDQWIYGCRLALYDFILTRLTNYFLAHTVRQYDFLERVVETTRAVVKLMEVLDRRHP